MSIVMSYIAPIEASTAAFGIMTNVEVSAKDRKAAINQARRHLAARVIPRMGKATLSMRTSSKGRILSKHIEAGEHFVNEKIVCDCGGHFVADKHGDYVCNDCGAVNAFEDNFNMSTFEEDDEPLEDTTYEDGDSSPEADDYTKAKDGAVILEARLDEHLAAWKAEKSKRPEDEQYAKFVAQERKARHDAVMKANRTGIQKLLYEGKWNKAQKEYRLRRIMAAIKDGVQEPIIIRDFLGMDNLLYEDIKTLKADERIISVTAGRRTTLSLVDIPAEPRLVPFRAFETSFREAIVVRKTMPPMATHCAICGTAYSPATLKDFANCSGHHCSP